MIIHLLAQATPSPAPGSTTPPEVPDWLMPVVLAVLIAGIIIAMLRGNSATRGGGNSW